MARYVYKGTLDNYTDMRFVSDDYVLAAGETEGRGDVLPALPMDQIIARAAKTATLDDIIAVLPAAQQAALKARLEARKPIQARKATGAVARSAS